MEKISLKEAIKRIKFTIQHTHDELAVKKLKDAVYLLEMVDRIE